MKTFKRFFVSISISMLGALSSYGQYSLQLTGSSCLGNTSLNIIDANGNVVTGNIAGVEWFLNGIRINNASNLYVLPVNTSGAYSIIGYIPVGPGQYNSFSSDPIAVNIIDMNGTLSIKGPQYFVAGQSISFNSVLSGFTQISGYNDILWYVNGTNVAVASSYTSTTLKEGDVIVAKMAPNVCKTSGISSNSITLHTTAATWQLGSNASLYSNLNIGIGTAAPTAQLHLADIYPGGGGRNLQIGDDTYFSDIDVSNVLGLYSTTNSKAGLKLGSSGPTIFGNSNGCVGIGTTSPTNDLHIKALPSSVSADVILETPSKLWQLSGRSDRFAVMNPLTDTDYFTILNGGNVGIGIATPLASVKLHVEGNTYLNGKVGIGTTASVEDFKLSVKGKIRAEEVQIYSSTSWADFVFQNGYDLASIEAVETYIKANGHLKDVPSSAEVEKNGIKVGEMDATLLRKIEEAMLYIIAQEKRIKELESKLK